MNECQYCNHTRNCKPLNIRLEPTAPDKKLAFVQNVLDVLIESRFGPGRPTHIVLHLSNRPELESGVFLDFDDGEMTPCYAQDPEGRYHYQVAEMCYRKFKAKEAERSQPKGANDSPQGLGRGSPKLLWDVTIAEKPP